MNKLTEMLTHNLGWKVVSLVAAVIMWFLVVSIDDPIMERSLPVLLGIVGQDILMENSYVLLNADELESTIINLMVRGRNSVLNEIRGSHTLTAYIDLTPIDISLSSELGKRLPVRVKYDNSSSSYDILRSTPGEVDVVLDRYVTRRIPVVVEKLDEDKDGYISLDPVATPESVTISGPLSIIDTIAEVKTAVEVGEAIDDFVIVLPLSVLNAEGRDISENLEVSDSEVNVFVGIETYARIPVNMPRTVGTVAEGYRITAIDVSPRTIEVEGNSNDIKALTSIALADIDVTGIDRTKVETYDMSAYLAASNLSIHQDSTSRVRVTVTVEREITKEILIPVDKIEIQGMTGGVYLPAGEVRLEVQGIASEIVAFEQSEMESSIDVTDLPPGTYNLYVNLKTPEGITQTGTEAIEVIIEGDEELSPDEPDQDVTENDGD